MPADPEVLRESDILCGQIWRDSGTPHRWCVTSVVRDHLIGDLYETVVMMINEFDSRDTMRIPGSVLLKDYELERAKPAYVDAKVMQAVAAQIEAAVVARRLQGDTMISLTATPNTWSIVIAALAGPPPPTPHASHKGDRTDG